MIQVSPPTRGWTPCEVVSAVSLRGFPAHAGMDPSGTITSGPWLRFPRPRGDGPQQRVSR